MGGSRYNSKEVRAILRSVEASPNTGRRAGERRGGADIIGYVRKGHIVGHRRPDNAKRMFIGM